MLLKPRSKAERTVTILGILMLGLVLTACFAFAGSDFTKDFGIKLDNFTKAIIALAVPVAGAAWVIAKLWQLVIPEKQGRMEPKEWARSVLVTLVAIAIGGKVIQWIWDAFSAQ